MFENGIVCIAVLFLLFLLFFFFFSFVCNKILSNLLTLANVSLIYLVYQTQDFIFHFDIIGWKGENKDEIDNKINNIQADAAQASPMSKNI